MYKELNERLNQAKEGMVRLNKIEAMLEDIESDLGLLELKKKSLLKEKEKEENDYETLEQSTLKKRFYRVLGDLDQRLEKERQEALSASLKYEQCLRDIESTTYERNKLFEERNRYINSNYDYDSILAEKRELLLKNNTIETEIIMDLTEKIAQCKANEKEIDEAIMAGERVFAALENAKDSLESASDWGVWDIMGGGFISDMAKHSHIDDAKDYAVQAQTLLRQFKSELTDINISEEIRIDISEFGTFADFFFDGLIADWCMQSKINQSLDSVLSVKDRVKAALSKLRRLKAMEEATIEDHLAIIESTIIHAQ